MKHFFIIPFLLWFANSRAQYDLLRFKMVENALLHKLDINGIHTSRDGRLWFGTSEGLASFDGNDVKLYPQQTQSNSAVITDRILAFAEDKNGSIWIYTTGRQLARFSPFTGKYEVIDFLKNDSLKAELSVSKLYVDNDNQLWLGTNRGFFIYHLQSGTYEQYNLKPLERATWAKKYENTVYDFGEDVHDKNKMWIASHGLGILSFDERTKKLQRTFRAAASDSVIQDGFVTQIDVQDSVIWFGTWGKGIGKYSINTGVYQLYPRNGKMHQDVYPHGHVIRGLVRQSNEEYLVALGDTLPAVFNTRMGTYTYISNEALRKTINRTSAIAKDNRGNVWCVKGRRLYSASTSFNLFTTLPVPLQRAHPFPPANILYTVVWDPKQEVYYAPVDQGDGVYVYDKSFQLLSVIPALPNYNHDNLSAARDAVVDGRGRFWVWGDVLSVYDSTKKRMVPAAGKYKTVPLFKQTFKALGTTPEGNLILLNDKRQLCLFNVTTFQAQFVSLPLVKKPAVEFHPRKLLFDVERKLVYACDGAAVFQYRVTDGRFQMLEVAASSALPQVNVSTYALDHGGNLWVGSRGIYIFEPSALRLVKKLDTKDGLTDNVNINLLQGPPGYMFFFTPHGGNLFSTSDSTFVHFDLRNGTPTDMPEGYSLANNYLFFSPSAGAQNVYADISSFLSLKITVQPYLSGIKVLNEELAADTVPQFLSNLELNHDQSTIGFSFSSTTFAFPDKVEYSYWLQGLEKSWTLTDYMNRSVTYTNLNAGTYTLHIKARMLGGKWTEMKQPLQIIIVPAFWQTTVFKIAAVLLLAFCIYLLFQQRLKNIRKKEAIKAAHQVKLAEMEADALRAQMNPHFIFNCLNSIKALIQKGENETAATYLTTFSKLIRTLFQHADKREVTLHEEIETCKLYTQLEGLRFGHKISFDFDVDENIDAKDISVPALILQPFIENAIWHGLVPKEEGGKITISIHQNKGSIQCVIDDEGIGRELSNQYKSSHAATHPSKGIALTRSRLSLDRIINHRDDSIEMIDKKDNNGRAAGTTVILSFKNEKE